jgi:hypothetical protein
MKKFLGVIFLSLLLSGCSSPIVSKDIQKQLIEDKNIKLGMSFSELRSLLNNNLYSYYPLKRSDDGFHKWGRKLDSDMNYAFERAIIGKTVLGKDKFIYKLTKIFENKVEATEYYLKKSSIHPKDKMQLIDDKNRYSVKLLEKEKAAKIAEENNKSKEEKEQIELARIIKKSKDTCITLGFDEDSNKFSDCTLKLYSQEVDNIVALKVAEQKVSTSSSSGSMTIYDPVRDRQNQIDRGMKMLSGGCTLGIDC